MKSFKSIISGFLAIAIVISLTTPAFAIDPGTVVGALEVAPDFGSWLWDTAKTGGNLIAGFIDNDNYCPGAGASLNGRHDFAPQHTQVNGKTGMFYICQNCGKSAGEVLAPAYDAYVDTLPAPGYTSGGNLLWQPSARDCFELLFSYVPFGGSYSKLTNTDLGVELPFQGDIAVDYNSENTGFHVTQGPHSAFFFETKYSCIVKTAISGFYRRVESPMCAFSLTYSSSGTDSKSFFFTEESQKRYYDVGSNLFLSGTGRLYAASSTFVYVSGDLFLPVYEIIPDSSIVGSTNSVYNINTRPTSITGGNYGIVGDNGQIIKVEDNRTIVNETNSTFYNPATGQTVPITGWSFDYSDRSYKVTLQSGDIVTITYGDENITIKEGDTIYNIYYLIDGSGSGSGEHTHDWRESGLTLATCLSPGVKTYICAGCQDTKPESIPALGHNWRILRTVTTQYDDEGLLIQEGYVLYECERCGEQYRTTDTSVKPNPGDPGNTGPGSGSGSGTDPGGGDKETIWDKLGNLVGSILGGLIGMVEAVLGKILDALTALADMLMGKLKTVVETVLSIFDELPKLFGGFLSFLTAVFPFLPPELMTILTFGILAVVFIGILKAVRR